MADLSFCSDDGTMSSVKMTIDFNEDESFFQTPLSEPLYSSKSDQSGHINWTMKNSNRDNCNSSIPLTPATVSTASCSLSSTSSSYNNSPFVCSATRETADDMVMRLRMKDTTISTTSTNPMDDSIDSDEIPHPLDEDRDRASQSGEDEVLFQSSDSHNCHRFKKLNHHEQLSLLEHVHSTSSVWIPLPSPSRPRLDPRYAARLPQSLIQLQHSQHLQSQHQQQLHRNSSGRRVNGTTLSCDTELMPPPPVTRNAGIFRPTPILSSSYSDDSRLHSSLIGALSSTAHNIPSPLSTSSTILCNTTSSSDTYTNNLNHNPHWFSASMRTNSTTSELTMSTFTPLSSSFVSLTTTPTSNSATGGAASIRPSKRTKADIGVSDRYIPNRATSNFTFNLWENMPSRRNSAVYGSNNSSNDSHGSISNGGNVGNNSGRDGDDRHGSNNGNNSNGSSSNSTNNDSSVGGGDSSGNGNGGTSSSSLNTVSGSSRGLLSTLLRSELLGENENPMSISSSYHLGSGSVGSGNVTGLHGRGSRGNCSPLQDGGNYLRYRSPRQAYQENLFDGAVGSSAIMNSFSLIPVGSAASQRLMATPPKRKRRISKVPFKVLDAPALQDDFYLNLVDWSSQNVLAVGLGSCVYLWSACTSKVTKLCDLSSSDDIVTSVSWAQRGTHLAVGTNQGEVQLWDTIKCKKVRSMGGHAVRVGTLAWTGPILASGSRDRLIYLRDVRIQNPYTDKLTNHKQEVCGLKWSFEEPSFFLASGGNDNNLHVIDSRNPTEPLHRFAEHTAAVKAIAWSPHQHGLLASGGGTADRCIRFWNTLSGSSLNKIDTGSQVCNLAWSQNCNELVSTHGYSLNQIVVWRYPSMTKVTTLTGHTYRVLYLAMSPDGSTIVTGAGDETLRFWQIFPGPRSDLKDHYCSGGSLLFPHTIGSVVR